MTGVSEGLQVLVVDEDDDSAATLAILLKRCGHDAHLATSGEIALRQAPELKPDALFVDLGIPGADAFAVARRFRSLPAFAATPIVAVSRFADDAQLAEARAAGFDDYLVKPYSVDNLGALMARVRARITASRNRVLSTYAAAHQTRELTRASRRSLDEYKRQQRLAAKQPAPVVAFLGCDAAALSMAETLPPDERPLTMSFDALDAMAAALDEPFPARRKCVVVDATNEGVDAQAAIRQLAGGLMPVPVVALVAASDVTTAVQLMRAGAHDVIEKSRSGELLDAVAYACEQVPLAGPAGHLADDYPARLDLSDAERRLIQLTVEGAVNKQIARELGVCLRTVHFRRAAVMKKLGARSNADLIRIAVQAGLV